MFKEKIKIIFLKVYTKKGIRKRSYKRKRIEVNIRIYTQDAQVLRIPMTNAVNALSTAITTLSEEEPNHVDRENQPSRR